MSQPQRNSAKPYGSEAKPSLFFVKDSGIYLMSGGIPGLAREEGRPAQQVAYAKGYLPRCPSPDKRGGATS